MMLLPYTLGRWREADDVDYTSRSQARQQMGAVDEGSLDERSGKGMSKQIIVKHKNVDRMSRWSWKLIAGENVEFSIQTYI